MHIFITGASGFIGRAVVDELLRNGHTVTGLARNDESAQKLTSMGAQVHRGSIDDLASLKAGAAASEGVIHLAFDHNFADFVGSCRRDALAIEAIGAALADTNRPFVVTSGLMLLPKGRLVTEDDLPDTSNIMTATRGANEKVALDFANKGVRVSVMRLAPTNHGEGDQGFITVLAAKAIEKGVSAYVGDGSNRWPATHRLDAATAFRLALEKGEAGAVYHAAAEDGVLVKEIAEEIGRRLNVPVVSKSTDEAPAHFGWLGSFLGADAYASSIKTTNHLGWKPTHPGLLSDIKTGIYDKGDTPLKG